MIEIPTHRTTDEIDARLLRWAYECPKLNDENLLAYEYKDLLDELLKEVGY